VRTGIAFGSNVGDRLQNLREARARLLALPIAHEPVLTSRIYETEPAGCEPGTASYLNVVIEIEFDGHPVTLLDALQKIEKELGRPSKRPRNAPRTIDLDVLYVGNLVLANDEIVIPHPRLHLRRFVLAPLTDIRPALMLPGQHETAAQLLAKLPPSDAAIFPETL